LVLAVEGVVPSTSVITVNCATEPRGMGFDETSVTVAWVAVPISIPE
jgi:hypothetical protein